MATGSITKKLDRLGHSVHHFLTWFAVKELKRSYYNSVGIRVEGPHCLLSP